MLLFNIINSEIHIIDHESDYNTTTKFSFTSLPINL